MAEVTREELVEANARLTEKIGMLQKLQEEFQSESNRSYEELCGEWA